MTENTKVGDADFPQFAGSPDVLRFQLRELLAERGVSRIDALLDELPDIQGALATVSYYDDQCPKSTSLLVHLLRSGEKATYRRPQPTATLGGRERFQDEQQYWLDAGFTEAESIFAASAALTRGRPDVDVMREHLRLTRPSLYESKENT